MATDAPVADAPDPAAAAGPSTLTRATLPPDASIFTGPREATGYHSAFRVDGEFIVFVDQRRLPFALAEIECKTAAEVATAIADRAIVGGPAMAQAAALGLAYTANRIRQTRPYARRAILRAGELALLQAHPTSRGLTAAVRRIMDRYAAVGELDEDGNRIADAMLAEADAIVFEATDDHGRLADAAATRIPRRTERPAGILTLGSTGAMASGQFGTALGAVQAAAWAERDVHVYVLESRPHLDGARIAVWELAQAGIPHTVLPDGAAGALLQSGTIDVVLVGAESIALNGDVANDAGTYTVAAVASRHNVPVIVCAPLAAVDPTAETGSGLVTSERPRLEITEFGKVALTLPGTDAFNPVVDITPAGLITAIATEEGLLEGSLRLGIDVALSSRARRLPQSLSGATLIDG